MTTKRGLAAPCVHLALPMMRRLRLQLSSVDQVKSRKRRAGLPVASASARAARRPLGDRREIGRSDLLNNIIRNFAQQPEKEAAPALIDCAVGLRRGAVQAMQRGHRAAEARGMSGSAVDAG